MSLLEAIILGIIQGLTEFLPISSSAHLALVPWLCNWNLNPELAFVFDVLVQLGTLLAVVVYFWKDILRLFQAVFRSIRTRNWFDPEARIAWFVVIATIPGIIAGLTIKKLVTAAFENPPVIAGFLLTTAAWMLIAEMAYSPKKDLSRMNVWDSIWIGLAQAVALFPGISRSGATLGAGLVRGVDRPSAARFSFLMSIPIMLGAGAVESLDVVRSPGLQAGILPIAVGTLTAAIVGFIAIAWLMRFLKNHSLRVFSAYCAFAGVAVLAVGFMR